MKMIRYEIDDTIKEQFDYYKNMCALLSEFTDSEFGPPAEIEKIEQWEKDNNVRLPHQYKSWLLLTEYARIIGGYIEFRWPQMGSSDAENDVIVIGAVVGDGEELLISRESGKIFSFFDGETEEYEDFDDLLTCLSGFMEHSAEEYLGADWGDIYDERFELG
ncbi:hypothetical protein [Ruminococcus flavefaciens]|uniref:hypothetical protein n=1 Tax=Ruminococcus flavefaciens TaxID=1265 RepID=UPI0015633B36|nr:hypothetical protein [Ruminococcus flavefaciens]